MTTMNSNDTATAVPPSLPPTDRASSDIDIALEIDFINLNLGHPLRQSLYEDDGIQHGCCAHDFCMIHPSLREQSIAGSVHICSNCRLNIHAVLTCGETAADINLDGNKYDLRYFHPFGKEMLKSSTSPENIYFCYTCLDQIKEATARNVLPPPFHPPCGRAVGGGAPPGDGSTSRIALLLPAGEVHPPATMYKVMMDNKDELDYKNLDVSAGATNPVEKKKTAGLTKLRGIKLGDGLLLEITDIRLDGLRSIGSKFGIAKSRNMSKKEMADALVSYCARKEQQALNGMLDPTDSSGAPIRINNARYLNVLFGAVIVADLKVRGESLTATQLQNKMRTDEGLHRKIIEEYNDSSNAAYGANAHGQGCGYKDASNFQAIPDDMWQKSLDKFKELTKEYESCLNRWTQSGTHCEFEDVEPPPEAECTNLSMIYMHHHLRAHPDLLETCLGLLPDGVFRQSSSDAPRNGIRGGNTRRERRSGSGRGSGGRGKSSTADACLDSIKAKNNAQQKNILMDTHTKLRTQLHNEKQNKKVFYEELHDHFDDDRDVVRRNIKRYKKQYTGSGSNGAGTGSNNNASNIDEEESEDEFTESQESTLGNYVETEEQIAFLKKQLESNKKEMEKM